MSSLFDLSGKVIVVAGGAGRICATACGALADHGARVVVADVDEDAGRAVADACGEAAVYEPLDVTDDGSIARLFERVDDRFGRLDVQVNAAYPRDDSYGTRFTERPPDSWRANVDAQLNATATLCREAIGRMRTQESGGSVINFGSTYGMAAPDFAVYDEADMAPSPAHYSASKAGILNLTRWLAARYGPDGVRVNAVSPGGVFDDQDEQFVAAYERRTPLGRMARSEDLHGALVYLASDASGYVTGHTLAVDGGWTTT